MVVDEPALAGRGSERVLGLRLTGAEIEGADVLALPRMPGLLGVALSGAGPSVIALATDRFEEIGKAIANRFELKGVTSTIRILEAAQEGAASRLRASPL